MDSDGGEGLRRVSVGRSQSDVGWWKPMEHHGHDETTNNEHETVSGGKYDGQWLRSHFAQTRTKSTQKLCMGAPASHKYKLYSFSTRVQLSFIDTRSIFVYRHSFTIIAPPLDSGIRIQDHYLRYKKTASKSKTFPPSQSLISRRSRRCSLLHSHLSTLGQR
jgi:hypothetical protein